MAALPPLYYTSPRGQCAVMLLAALHEMFLKDAMATATKREAILRIKMNHWFDLHDEDLEPYPSQRLLTGEPRWRSAPSLRVKLWRLAVAEINERSVLRARD